MTKLATGCAAQKGKTQWALLPTKDKPPTKMNDETHEYTSMSSYNSGYPLNLFLNTTTVIIYK